MNIRSPRQFLHQPSANLCRRLLEPLLQRPGRISALTGRFLDAITSYHDLPARNVGSIICASLLGYSFFVLSAWVLAEGMHLGIGLIAIAGFAP